MTSQTTLPSTITDADLCAWIERDFGKRGGGTRLSAALGVSIATGCAIVRGDKAGTLVKVAAHYGYVETTPGSYRFAGSKAPKPTAVGYRRGDLVEHKQAILAALADARNRSIAQAAKASGFAYNTVRRVLDEALAGQNDAA